MAFDGKQIRNATIVGAKIANLAITDAQLAANAVTTAKIANLAVDGTKLADGAVVEAKIGDSAVTTGKLADGAVTLDKLAGSAIDATKLADESVTLAKLAPDSVDSSKIVDGSITGGDIAENTIAAANLDTAYEGGLVYRNGTRAMTGALDLGTGNKIINLANPTQAQDAATKAYVDSVSSSLDLKESVRVATTAEIVLSNVTTEVDGVTLADGDRILVKDQTNLSRNGIWVVSTSDLWTRATDADADAEVTAGLFTFVEEGEVNQKTGWVLTSPNPITVDTSDLEFTQFSGAGTYLAGFGLTLDGNTFAVEFNNTDATIANVGTQGAGASNLAARADHSHALGAGSVGSTALAAGSVTDAALAANAVTTEKILNGAVTFEKIDQAAFTPVANYVEQNYLRCNGMQPDGEGGWIPQQLTGTIDVNGQELINLPNIMAGAEFYSTNAVNARSMYHRFLATAHKEPVLVATTENITLAGLQIIDGLSLEGSERVLVKDQTDPVENGIYQASSGAWERTADFPPYGMLDGGSGVVTKVQKGAQVAVIAGETNARTTWMLATTNQYPAVGTDALVFQAVGVTKAYVDAAIENGAVALTQHDVDNKSMAGEVTEEDGDLACATAISFPPRGYVQVFVNGIKAVLSGDLTGECYFSADSGATARALDAVQVGDLLYWNGSVAGYELAATDRIDFDYLHALEVEPA